MKKIYSAIIFCFCIFNFANGQALDIRIYFQQFTVTNPIATGTYQTVSNVYFANYGATGTFDLECDLYDSFGNFVTVIGKICGVSMTSGFYYGPYTFNSSSIAANPMPAVCGNYQIAFIVSNTSCPPACGTKPLSCLYNVAANGYTLPYPITVNGCAGCTAPNNGVISPSSPTVTAPNSINLSVSANGTAPFTYQWWIWNGSAWVALTNSPPYSGTTNQTMTINPTATGMSGNFYTCVVTNACGSQTNIPSVQLTVNSGSSCLSCPSYDYSISPTTSWQTHNSSITTGSCKKYYVNLTAGNTYTFSACAADGGSATYDTYFTLYNSSCTNIAFNDDNCGTQSYLTYTPSSSGDYYFEVNSCCTGGSGGSYTLAYKYTSSSSCLSCPFYDYAITPTTSWQTHSSSITTGSCKKYYVNLTAGNTYTFSACAADGGSASYDSYFILYNSSCTNIAFNDDNCGTQSYLSYTPSSSGDYYFEVNSCCTGGSSGNYTVAYKYAAAGATVTVNSNTVAPWQRATESYNVTMNATTSDNSNWRIVAHDVNGNNADQYSSYQSSGSTISNYSFTFSNPTSAIVYYAQSSGGSTSANIGSQTEIIEAKWNNKNVVFYNSGTNQLLIPLHYFSNTISTTISFSRISSTSSYSGNIVTGPTVQSGNQEYFAIDYSNSLIQDVKAGTFNYTINYNPSAFYTESGTFDLTKVGNINTSNNGNNNIVVLVGGCMDIETAIHSLPNQNTSASLLNWSVVNNISNDYGKNTWYVATPNINPLQKNAYNIGIALEEIRKQCINAGASSPNISVIAHSKGGLEMRIMLDGKGAPISSPYNFTLSPSNPFTNTSINNSLNAVVFLGTPHYGVETGFQENAIAPFSYVSNEINAPQIKSYFLNGTSVPNNIRIANVAAYRKCNLSDAAVDLTSSDYFTINGAATTKRFYVKSVPFQDNNDAQDIFDIFCNQGGCFGFLGFAATPPPFTGLAALYVPCELACNASTIWSFYQAIYGNTATWNDAFHHGYLTSSYVLNDPSVTCLADNISSAYGVLDKLMAVVNNTSVPDCVSPLSQSCPPAWWQLISSVLQNATVSKKNFDSTYTVIAKSDENGMLQLPLDGTLSLGDSLKIEAPGVETIFLTMDSTMLANGKAKIPFIKSSAPTLRIMYPSFTLVNQNPITSNSVIQVKVKCDNALSYEILTNHDTLFTPLVLFNDIATFTLDTGRNLFVVKFIGQVDTVSVSKEIWYLPDSIMSNFAYPIFINANNNTVGTKIYDEKNNNQFIKEVNLFNDTIPLLKQQNNLRLIRFGFRDTTVVVDSTTNIDLTTLLTPIFYSSISDSSVIDFSSSYKSNYWKTISFLDSAMQNIISIKQYDDNFSGMSLIPKSRKFEVRHLNAQWSDIRFAAVLDQIENLSTDSIYLLRVFDDTSFTKILFDTAATVSGYDSAVQKLSYNYINFNSGTANKEALVIMKKQAPIVNTVSNFSVNENDTLSISIAQFFSDPDSIHNDMTIQLVNSTSQLNIQVAGDSIFIMPTLCWNGNGTFTLQATHDGLTRTISDSVTVTPLPNPTITAGGTTTFCQGNYVSLSASSGVSYMWSNSATTQTISATVSGNYTVAVTDIYNCTRTSQATSVTVLLLPNVNVTASGATTFCSGDSVTLTVPTSANYLWSNGSTTQFITTSLAGNYFVTVTDANNCSATSIATSVTVNSLPISDGGNTVTILQGNSTVIGGIPTATGNAPFTYSWTPTTGLDSSNVANPTASPQDTTTYTVVVTDANGCISIDSILVIVTVPTGIIEPANGVGLLVFPNPTNELLNITGTKIENGEYSFELKNVVGQTIFAEKLKVSNHSLQKQFSLSELSGGMYFLIIENGNTRTVTKVQKMN